MGGVTTETPSRSGGAEPLRPQDLSDFAGQPDVVGQLRIVLGATKARGELVCPHLLFAGPPGLGKTTLSNIVATELGLPLITTSGPAIDKTAALAALLVSLAGPTVVFIDEIHRLAPDVQEMLYSAMEDGRVDVLVAEGTARATAYSMDVEPFVLVGATTEAGRLARPFLDRFGYVGRLEPYDHDTLTGIVMRSAGLLGVSVTHDACAMIAARSRGTPRIANQLLGRVRDTASVSGLEAVDAELAEMALALFGIDAEGLSKVDRLVLSTLVGSFGGGPVGLNTLAMAIHEDPLTLEVSHEPYLMRSGLIQRTPRGRAATARTYTYLGLAIPAALDVDAGGAGELPLGV